MISKAVAAGSSVSVAPLRSRLRLAWEPVGGLFPGAVGLAEQLLDVGFLAVAYYLGAGRGRFGLWWSVEEHL